MSSTFDSNLRISIFGQSHSGGIGCVIDGLPAGERIDMDRLSAFLSRRAPGKNAWSTPRKEADLPEFLSGLVDDTTCGAPLSAVIRNTNTRSQDYSELRDVPRPGHADYTANCKYHGYQDYRGGGHFSGRITVALVAAGAIIQSALEKKGVYVGTHIKKCADVCDRDFENYVEDIKSLHVAQFSILDENSKEKMLSKTTEIKANGDSVGGIMQTAIYGVPAGLGEPWFDSLESMLSHAMFSIPAVKGVEFGIGFGCADMRGSEMNDEFYVSGESILTKSNNNGGINGGISNGMPIVFNCAVKPTSSIPRKQKTVNFIDKYDTEIEISGRHDSTIIPRACVVAETLSGIVIADLLIGRYGTDYLL